MHWTALPQKYIHGNLLGYRVSYTDPGSSDKEWQEQTVDNITTDVIISNLAKYTKYIVQVEAFTKIGQGTPSKPREVWTDEDGWYSESSRLISEV